jgi:hypothetical protein
MAERRIFHSVLTKEDGWVVKSEGSIVSRHGTQQESEAAAIVHGNRVHEAGGLAQAVLHKSDGTIREERTYGEDPERTPG